MKITNLSNGLKVVHEKSTNSHVTSMQIWVKCGSVNELEHENGISHFIEHILFKASKNHGLGEIADSIERMGGELNAFTGKDHTCYYVTVPSVYYKEALAILRDLVFYPLMDDKDIEDEREVILEEIRRYQDIPSSVANDMYYELQFKGHPYARPIQGTVEVVKGISVKDIKDYYSRFYSPVNSTLVICGDVDEDDAFMCAGSVFSGLRDSSAVLPEVEPSIPAGACSCNVLEMDVCESVLYFGFSAPGLFHEDVPALDILANIVGQSESSRLVKRLRVEKGLVTSISAICYTPKHGGCFAFGVSFESKADKFTDMLATILSETHSTLSEISLKGFSDEELERAKTIILSEKVYEKRTVDGMASRIGRLISTTGDVVFEEKYIEQIKKISKKDLINVFNKYLCGGAFSASAVVPKGSKLPSDHLCSILKENISRLEKYNGAEPVAGHQATMAGFDFNIIGNNEQPSLSRYKSGARIITKRFGDIPLASLYVCFPGGVSYEDKSNNGVSNLASRTLMYGAGKLTYDQIAGKLDSTASYFDIFSGRDGFGVSLSVLRPYFNEVLDVIKQVLTEPRFEEEYFMSEKKVVENEIASLKDNLSSYTLSLFLKTLYKKSSYRFESIGTKASVGRLARQDAEDFYYGILDPKKMVIVFSGDFDKDAALDWGEEISSVKNKKESIADKNTIEPEQSSQRLHTETKDVKQAHIMLGYRTCNVIDEDVPALKVLAGVLLGQSGRLFVNLRDKQSLAYSVFPMQMNGVHSGYFAVYIASEHSKVDRCIKGMRQEIARLKEELVSDEELTRSKNYLVGIKEIELQTSCAQSLNMGLYEFYGKGFKKAFEYSESIMKINKTDIQKVAQKYFLDHKENVVILTK